MLHPRIDINYLSPMRMGVTVPVPYTINHHIGPPLDQRHDKSSYHASGPFQTSAWYIIHILTGLILNRNTSDFGLVYTYYGVQNKKTVSNIDKILIGGHLEKILQCKKNSASKLRAASMQKVYEEQYNL